MLTAYALSYITNQRQNNPDTTCNDMIIEKIWSVLLSLKYILLRTVQSQVTIFLIHLE